MSEIIKTNIPDWVSAEAFANLLREHEPGFKKIQKFHAEPALAAGENYTTILLKLEIRFELNDGKVADKFFVLKIPSHSLMMQHFMERFDVFEMEHNIYTKVIPEVEELYRNAGAKVCFGAKYYDFKTPDGSRSLLLENLSARGFKNTKRQDGLDEEHTKRVLKKLAQWHAGTATRIATRGSYNLTSMYDSFLEHKAEVQVIHNGFTLALKKCVPTYKGSELYADQVLKLQNNYADELFEALKVDPSEFNVLNHGDCWSNNAMFQYADDGSINECYFVDFQMPNYGSPTRDLQYFIFSSTKLEIKIAKFDALIKYYHDQLVEHLRLLKYPKKLPTLKEIHMSLIKYGFLGYSAAVGIMGAVQADPSESANMDNFINADESGMDFKMKILGSSTFRKHIEQLLPWLYYRGALECEVEHK